MLNRTQDLRKKKAHASVFSKCEYKTENVKTLDI